MAKWIQIGERTLNVDSFSGFRLTGQGELRLRTSSGTLMVRGPGAALLHRKLLEITTPEKFDLPAGTTIER